mgnify:CR=1 FL=1
MQTPEAQLVEQARIYQAIVLEYCQLALQPTLDDPAANRIAEILAQAESEPLLSLLLDEADHLIAHQQGAIDHQHIEHQQQQLKVAIEALWVDLLLQDIQPLPGLPTPSQ